MAAAQGMEYFIHVDTDQGEAATKKLHQTIKNTGGVVEEAAKKGGGAWSAFGTRLTDTMSHIGHSAHEAFSEMQGSMLGGILTGNILANVITKAAEAIYEFGKEIIETAATMQRLERVNEALAESHGVSAERVSQLTEKIKGLGYTAKQTLVLMNEMLNIGADLNLAPAVAMAAKIGAAIAGTDKAEATKKIIEAAETGMSRQLRSMQVFLDLNGAVTAEENKQGRLMEEAEKQAFRLQLILKKINENEAVAVSVAGDIISQWKKVHLAVDEAKDSLAKLSEGSVQAGADFAVGFLKGVQKLQDWSDALDALILNRGPNKKGVEEMAAEVRQRKLVEMQTKALGEKAKLEEKAQGVSEAKAQKERSEMKRHGDELLASEEYLASAKQAEYGGLAALEVEYQKLLKKRHTDEFGKAITDTATGQAKQNLDDALLLKIATDNRKTALEVNKIWSEARTAQFEAEKESIKGRAEHEIAGVEGQAAQALITQRALEDAKLAIKDAAIQKTAALEIANNNRLSDLAIAAYREEETKKAKGDAVRLAIIGQGAKEMQEKTTAQDLKIQADANATSLAMHDDLNNTRFARDREAAEATRKMEFETETAWRGRRLVNLDAEKAIQIDSLAYVNAQSLTAKVGLEQRKLAIEVGYLQRREGLELAALDRAHQREMEDLLKIQAAKGTSAQVNAKEVSALQDKQREESLAKAADADIAIAAEQRKTAIAQYNQVQEHLRGQYETLKNEVGGIFDAIFDKGESIWQAIGNSLKNVFKNTFKEIVTSQFAGSLMGLFTGATTKMEGGHGPGGMIGGNPVFTLPGGNPVAQALTQAATPIAEAGSAVAFALAATANAISKVGTGSDSSFASAGLSTGTGAGYSSGGGTSLMAGLPGMAAGSSPAFGGGGGGLAGWTPQGFGGVGAGLAGWTPGGPGATPPFIGGGGGAAAAGHGATGLGGMMPGAAGPGGQGFQFQKYLQNLKGFVGFGDNKVNLSGNSYMTGSEILQGGTLGEKAAAVGQSGAFLAAGTMLAMDGWKNRRTNRGTAEMAAGGAMAGYNLGSKLGGSMGMYGGIAGAGAGIMIGGLSQGNLGESIAGGAVAGYGVGSMIGGPIGGAIGAGAGALFGGIAELFGLGRDPVEKVREKIKSYWGLDVSSNSVLEQIWELIKGNYKGNIDLAMPSPEIRHILEMYAQMTGQPWRGRNTPGLNVSLLQRNGSLSFGASTSDLGALVNGGWTSAGGIGGGVVSNPASNGAPVVLKASLSLDGATAAAFLQGQAVEAMGNNPRAVGSAVNASYASNYGRRENYASATEPGLVTS